MYVPALTTREISIVNLYARPYRTLCLITLITVLSFILSGGSLISLSLIKGVDSMSKRLGADLLIVPQGYDRTIEGILLRSEPGVFYMDAEWLDRIASLEGVNRASPQLFITSLNSSCCTMPVQMIGFDAATDFVVGPWINTSAKKILSDGEIVIGSAISGNPGSIIKFFEREYRVIARLDRTGMGFDSSVFMSMDSARKAAADYALISGNAPFSDASISSILVSVDRGFTPRNVFDTIQKTFGYGGSGIMPVLSKNIITAVAGGLRNLIGFIVALIVILWLLVILVLTILFCITLGERVQEFGLFRAMGAKRKKLLSLMVCESALVSLAGSLLGICFSLLTILPLNTLIRERLQMPFIIPSVGGFLGIISLSLFFSFITGPLASLYPALKIARMDAYTAIRTNGL